ncbi:calpain 2, (m II) large subunit [Cadophora gregata]|uniref:calpain 2, (m II) large subunit n=1 Tax=Cadophora gregata TaxID=51156 RepID=UPI0026DA7617|nr:calpain 2, (m II) large subunit [Cadophora gregata]KAK0124621.1 calpain 2, (m II) large subunit [Cadophora gregata]KAK0129522.1 calpain 2, (m II) large subunit [Cadophora gregata f. sp. sojae]
MSIIPSLPKLTSQELIDKFWEKRIGKNASKIAKPPTVLPKNVLTQMVGNNMPQGIVTGRPVTESYDHAVKECEIKVRQIIAECRRTNTKYCDPHFDLDDMEYCLTALSGKKDPPLSPPVDTAVTFEVTQRAVSAGEQISWGNVQPDQVGQQDGPPPSSGPACAKRVGAIFEEPKFHVKKDVHVKDLRQGAEGDCWFIASLGSLCVEERFSHLVERICPPQLRDEKVGVYGFVFHRDGEWVSEIIDDKLYLSAPDYDDCDDSRRAVWDSAHFRLDPEVSRKLYKKTFQTGSDALHFASCAHPQETWVPLLEKAFAKAHGDFEAIAGGWPGEGVEDLTGGITTEIVSADILDRDQLWTESFLNVNKEFLFGAGTRHYGSSSEDRAGGRQGIQDGHAYSVLRAVEYKGERLLMVKNPWGDTEWNGRWSDGSKEWTPEALKELDFTFGNEGIFWMPYESFLERFVEIWRARLFTEDWNVSQHWTTIQVPWSGDYNDTEFEFVLTEPTTTVIVLSQLDGRYFGGLTGQYSFNLAFRLHMAGQSDYVVRGYSSGERSAVAEVDLEPGTYRVLLQIEAFRRSYRPKIEDVVKENWLERRDKLIRIGLSYDLAHAKGKIEEKVVPKKVEEKKEEGKGEEKKLGEKNVEEEKAEATKLAEKQVEEMKPKDSSKASDATSSTEPESKPAADEPTHHQSSHPGEESLGGFGAEPNAPPPPPAPAHDDDSDDEDGEGDDAPWNAPLVVSLRVFCHKTAATIKVIRNDAEEVTAEMKPGLDVDDPEKDATKVVVAEQTDGEKEAGVEAGKKVDLTLQPKAV